MKIVGETKKIIRIETGLYSFDRAFLNQKGDIGFPIGSGVEIFGATFCGKSTITYGLAGMVARIINTNIVLADFEGFDPILMETILNTSGFDNTLTYIQDKEDETVLDTVIEYFRKKDCNVAIIDSIGAISPIAEETGELGDRNMGQRAFLMAQFSRKALRIVRNNEDKIIFMINHAYPQLGGRGMTTPGGEVKNYLNTIRIQVRRKFLKGKYEEFPDGSYIIEGTVKKNRWGYKDKVFNLFVLGGFGIHPGLTAMYDGITLKLVDRTKTIKIGDTSFGYLKDVTQQAREGNNAFFDPFFEILKNHANSENIILEDTEETDGTGDSENEGTTIEDSQEN